MSLDFSFDIQRTEFDLNNMQAWLNPALYKWFRLLLVVSKYGGYFLGKLSAPWYKLSILNTTAYLSIIADHIYLLMTTV